MSATSERVAVMTRIPPKVRRAIKRIASANERSVDAEVRMLLVRTYGEQSTVENAVAQR